MNHKNHFKLDDTQPLVMDEIYEQTDKPIEKPKQIEKPKEKNDDDEFIPKFGHETQKDTEYYLYKLKFKDGTYVRAARARKNLKNIPAIERFKNPNLWKTRTTEWEFKTECDYEIAFTNSERWAALVLTDYPRLEVEVIYEGRTYSSSPRYFAPNIVLGAILDCMLKKPLSCYIISSNGYYLTDELLDKTLKELYEKGIDFDTIYVNRKGLFYRLFIYCNFNTYPPYDEIPKTHDLEEDIRNGEQETHTTIYTKQLMHDIEEENRQYKRKCIEGYQRIYRKEFTKSISTQTDEN